MSETDTADTAPEQTAAPAKAPRRPLALSVDPGAPPMAQAAAAAYIVQYDELLTHAETHPGEDWVAYRGGQRVGFGTDHRELLRQCEERFPDGEFRVYYIDPILQYPDDTVV